MDAKFSVFLDGFWVVRAEIGGGIICDFWAKIRVLSQELIAIEKGRQNLSTAPSWRPCVQFWDVTDFIRSMISYRISRTFYIRDCRTFAQRNKVNRSTNCKRITRSNDLTVASFFCRILVCFVSCRNQLFPMRLPQNLDAASLGRFIGKAFPKVTTGHAFNPNLTRISYSMSVYRKNDSYAMLRVWSTSHTEQGIPTTSATWF